MDSRVSRRRVLQAGSVLATGPVAGCSYLDDPVYTTLAVANRTAEPKELTIQVFEVDSDERLYSTVLEVPAAEGSEAGRERIEQAFEREQANVEVRSRGFDGFVEQFTYYPYCPNEGQGDVLLIEIPNRDNDVLWQRACSSE